MSASQMPDLKTSCIRGLGIPPQLVVGAPTTAPVMNPTGGGASGGLLAAGTYFVKYTWVTADGYETPPSPESAQMTVGATNKPTATLPTFPVGVVSANIYATAANGASGTEVLYNTGNLTTTAPMNFAAGPPTSFTAASPPVAAPVAPTVTAAGGGATGGLLQPGQYYFSIAAVSAAGVEGSPCTPVGPVSVSAGNIPQIATPAMPSGGSTFNVYLSLANGPSSAMFRYASGVAASSNFACSAQQAASAPIAPPLAPTIAPVGAPTGGGATGGTLAAGNYLLKYTWIGANGLESSPSPESVSMTVGATNIPTITFPALPAGVIGIRLYATAAGGATNTEVLYNSPALPITTTTYNMALAVATAGNTVPPSSTGFVGNPVDLILTTGSVAMLVAVGQVQGNPTGITVAIQESSDLVSWTTVVDSATTVDNLTAAGNPNINGTAFGQSLLVPFTPNFGVTETVNEWKRSKRYFRPVVTFSGGTNPSALMNVEFIARRQMTGPLANPPSGYSPYPNIV